jgi:RNA polymerase sigma factor (sigma-70 family)
LNKRTPGEKFFLDPAVVEVHSSLERPPFMADDPDFADFLRRIRDGDDRAAEELVRRFEPMIRREVRMRLGDKRLQRAFDSVDVSQSVLADFLSQAAAGRYELEGPEQLVRLLVTMTRNRLVSRARRERRMVRDVSRLADEPGILAGILDSQPSPSEVVSREEQWDLLKKSLSDEELQIVDLRLAGNSWDEIAARLGGTGPARRMQLSRRLDRLEKQIGASD